MWSLGCILYEMMTLTRAFTATTLPELVRKVTHAQYTAVTGDVYTRQLVSIVHSLLSKSPSKRPLAKELLANTYIQQAATRFALGSGGEASGGGGGSSSSSNLLEEPEKRSNSTSSDRAAAMAGAIANDDDDMAYTKAEQAATQWLSKVRKGKGGGGGDQDQNSDIQTISHAVEHGRSVAANHPARRVSCVHQGGARDWRRRHQAKKGKTRH